MAGIASDVFLAIREFSVNILRHANHVAGNFLLGILVAGKVPLHMTEVAADSQSGSEGAHHAPDILRLQDLQIFWSLTAAAPTTLLGWILGKRKSAYKQQSSK